MLCSDCKKNNAVVFVNKKGEDGKNTLEGYCYDCAKKRGINPGFKHFFICENSESIQNA